MITKSDGDLVKDDFYIQHLALSEILLKSCVCLTQSFYFCFTRFYNHRFVRKLSVCHNLDVAFYGSLLYSQDQTERSSVVLPDKYFLFLVPHWEVKNYMPEYLQNYLPCTLETRYPVFSISGTP